LNSNVKEFINKRDKRVA